MDHTPISVLIDRRLTFIVDEASFQKLKEEPELADSKTNVFTCPGKEPLKLKGTFVAQIEKLLAKCLRKFYVTAGSVEEYR